MGLEAIEPGVGGGEVSVAGEDAGGGSLTGRDRGWSRPELEEAREVALEQREAFLEYVRGNRECSVREACEHVGLRRRDVRELLRLDPEFAEDYATARGRGVEQIHNQMVKLAIEGVDEPLVSMGQIVGTKRVYSERLLQTMFNALTPEGKATLGNKIGLEINTSGDVKVQTGVSFEELAALARRVGKEIPALEEEQAGEIVAETDESA